MRDRRFFMPVVRIPDEQFERLKLHAEPLVDGVGDVIARLLDYRASIAGSTFPLKETATSGVWLELARKFNSLNPPFFANAFPEQPLWSQVKTGRWEIHYEWMIRAGASVMDVSLHFEDHDASLNASRLETIKARSAEITKGISRHFLTGPRKDLKGASELTFRVPYRNGEITKDNIAEMASVMKTLIDRTWDHAKKL
jgi:hypothetical protein